MAYLFPTKSLQATTMKDTEPMYEKLPLTDDNVDQHHGGQFCASKAGWNTQTTNYLRNHPFQALSLNLVLLCASLLMFTASCVKNTTSTSNFVTKFSSYSPARSAVKYVSGTFNATQGAASGYVGTSNETDEMWEWV